MHFRRIGLPLLLVLAAACAPGVPGTIVTVGVLVAVSPSSAVVPPGASQKFQATVFGSSDTAVAWSVQESSGGSIGADGTYIAPAAAGSYHVVATSHADPTKSSAAPVSVTVPIGGDGTYTAPAMSGTYFPTRSTFPASRPSSAQIPGRVGGPGRYHETLHAPGEGQVGQR